MTNTTRNFNDVENPSVIHFLEWDFQKLKDVEYLNTSYLLKDKLNAVFNVKFDYISPLTFQVQHHCTGEYYVRFCRKGKKLYAHLFELSKDREIINSHLMYMNNVNNPCRKIQQRAQWLGLKRR